MLKGKLFLFKLVKVRINGCFNYQTFTVVILFARSFLCRIIWAHGIDMTTYLFQQHIHVWLNAKTKTYPAVIFELSMLLSQLYCNFQVITNLCVIAQEFIPILQNPC